MQPFKIDVPVLITFFIRSDTLKKVFDSVKIARPSTLLLWQDGPRSDADMDKIMACRAIVENIDWECNVYRNYHTENMGCDPSTYLSHKWAFEKVDKCIILEDDMVPSQSYYRFCKELLDKYEYDERINHICGINFVQDEVECSDDYLFSYYGTGAWASWRRVAKEWDETYSYLDDARAMSNVRGKYPALADTSYKTALKRRKSGKAYWETILGFNASLNNRLVIIPRVNLVSNIGVTDGATHGTSLWLMNRRVRKLFFMDAKDIDFPLMHPKYILPDYKYLDEMSKINCFGRPFLAFVRKVEYLIKRIVYTLFVKK